MAIRMNTFRDTFNADVLGINSEGEYLSDEPRAETSKLFSMSKYRELLLIYDDNNWGVNSLDNNVVEAADKRNSYAVVERTDPFTNTKYKALFKKEKGKDKSMDDWNEVKPRRLVVPILEIFDTIHECHQSIGHRGIGATFSKVSKKYSNITEDLCIKYIRLCPVCNEQQPL